MTKPELKLDMDMLSIRLARTPAEIEAAQHLRYKVFYEEYAATPNRQMAATRLDIDDYDTYADHLIVIDENGGPQGGKIVGTYRLLQRQNAERYGRFYSSNEFNLAHMLNSGASLLELGRSCVLPEYRTRPVMQLLWQGISDFVTEKGIEIMFGCASLPGTDIQNISRPLSYLHHYHVMEGPLCPRALKGRYINMNLIPKEDFDPKQAFAELPPLIKGYLRVGAEIGDGAVIDTQFNTTDVCIIVQTHRMTKRYRDHFERKNNGKSMTQVNDASNIYRL